MLPYSIFDCIWIAPLALILDILFGDPPLPWKHPVVAIGKAIHFFENPARTLLRVCPRKYEWLFGRILGGIVLLLVCAITLGVTLFLISIPYLGVFFAVYLSYAGLALGCLLKTGSFVLEAIEEKPLKKARRSLTALVSRDTSCMDRPILRKTLADTMTENFTDALCAPFFYLLLLGPLGLWVYKAISTMDSMWGYTTKKWLYLGFFGAKMDDVAAFIPARIAILGIGLYDTLISHFFPKKRQWIGTFPGFFAIHKQAIKMPSPNSGCSMNAFAWLLQARMAGPSVYFGTLVDKPYLGPPTCLAWNKKLLLTLFSCIQGAGLCTCFALWASILLAIFLV